MTTMAKIPKTTIKKLDKPRPLKMNKVLEKTQPDCVDIAEEIINLADSCSQKIQSSHLDQPTIAFQINTLWNSLKTFGPHLERVYKDRLDRAFVVFRNGSRDERLDQRSRLSLLELIELRAINWNSNDYMTTFYKQRQLDEMTIDAINSPTPSTPPMLGLSGQSLLQATVQSPPILNPGEVIRASGKFTKPTKIPGKNYSKDEVIIRNSDSGKVMGIKGRRVHMIEELSETIISFQRVNPGARERLVQITGPNEDKITYAKQLIEDTIRRNASPVREIQEKERICGSSSSLNSSASDDETYNHSGHHRSLQHSHSAHSNLEYKYTVVVGKQTIKIIGNDYNIVKIAKVILDEHLMTEVQKSKDMEDYASIISFEEDPFVANHEEFKEEIPTNSRIEEDPYIKEKDLTPAIANDMLNKTGGASAVGRSLLFASLQTPTRPPGEIKQMILPKLPLTPNQDVSRNDVYPKDMKSRRSFSTSTTITNVVKRLPYVYTTEQLKQFSEHPICKRQPANWLKIISEIPEISRKSDSSSKSAEGDDSTSGQSATEADPADHE